MLGIRFISILDNYDSVKDDESGQLLIAFKNIFNDAYCRDISMKIRSSLDNKRKNGQFIGSFATYGYKKDEADKNHLVIDEYPAEMIQHIFRMKLNGYNLRRIKAKLDELGVLTPMTYKRMCGFNYNSGFRSLSDGKWSISSILRILQNEMYTGTMVQNKSKKINYKIRESRSVDEADWIKVEGTHEPIIPKPIFNAVQELMTLDTRTSPNEEQLYVFSGFIKCADCGENMIRRNSHKTKSGEMKHSFICSTYVHSRGCTPHNIPEHLIEPIVLKAIQNQVSVLTEAERVMEQVRRQPEGMIRVQLYDRQIEEAEDEERRFLDLKTRLYQDMRDGVVSREEYLDMSARFSEKAESARKRKIELENVRTTICENSDSNALWMENFKSASEIEKLDRNTVVTLIDKIVIHNKAQIEVVFRHGDEMANYLAFAEECRQRMELRCEEIAEENRMEAVG